ncbi:glycine-rich domain-containing protein [Roseinatronobacter monicus]|uniref:Uncharacterized protein n=1 Tax=Roseinatronobacter monicus TaxID=393481 RepID=A0A543KBH3_9RHOB|nr:hypothetical protein [Roseinatronobacter monicus]TQM92416.1 hypothetical protein BD293_1022 [Roseinatronobacter monicus]
MQNDLFTAINNLDLEIITRNMQTKLNWSKAKAERVESQYRRFLFLCADDPTQTVPSAELDDYWEMHIQDTRKYAQDCMRTFGFFLHHVPNAMERVEGLTRIDLLDRFSTTKDRYKAVFGTRMLNAVMSACDECIPDYDSPSDPDPDVRTGIDGVERN